jgi:secondary thiamine-phosphate synthase enzyme
MHSIKVRSTKREEMIDITAEAAKFVRENSTGEGVLTLFTQHTTCGLTVNENADPDVKNDMLGFLERLIPQMEPHFKHGEQNSDAHIKSSLVGASASVPYDEWKLLLGRWQAIYLCEFDGPRERTILMTVK